MRAFEAAGVRLYALSYDEPQALADFADAFDITFTLLSDPDSSVIRQFGILNTLIAEDDHPWFGIPFPGSYVIAADGSIVAKLFENNLAVRAGPEQLLAGLRTSSRGELTQAAPVGEVAWEVALDGAQLVPSVQRDLVVRLHVPSGRHLYAHPAPSKMVALDLQLDPHPGVVQRPLLRPPSHTHRLAGTDEAFEVHDGVVELRLPITANSHLIASAERSVTLPGMLQWQCCDDAVCDVPRRERFELTIPVGRPVASEIGAPAGAAGVRRMNAAAHFQTMRSRRR